MNGPLASTAFATEWTMEQTAGTARSSPGAPVVVVVGFDGSEPAQRALDAAARLLRGRDGQLEVVHVAPVPGWTTTSAPGCSPRSPAGTFNAGTGRSRMS